MSIYSLMGFTFVFALCLLYWRRKTARKRKAATALPLLMRCDSCGHIDDYDNFDPNPAANNTFFCPSCDDWTFEELVETESR